VAPRAALERLTGWISCLAGISPCGHPAIVASRLRSYPSAEEFRRPSSVASSAPWLNRHGEAASETPIHTECLPRMSLGRFRRCRHLLVLAP
jgi:hypothetical protein